MKCKICVRTGNNDTQRGTVMTKQKWLQTADTEQLAEFLNRVFQAKAFCEICDIRKRCKISAGCKYGNKPYKECWKEWLKQPHTDKE